MPELSARITVAVMISSLSTKARALATDHIGNIVTVPERRVLFRLMQTHAGGPVPTTALLGEPGSGEITTTPALSRVVQALENQGYVLRSLSGQDHRLRLVEITPEGREVWHAMLAAFKSAADMTYGDLSDADMATLIEILGGIGVGIPDWPAREAATSSS